ncbi:Hydroxymethylglutaryl-CoA reductase (NADPH) protein [Dioscorea alata]|uniref:Hydroxymethylglutaryl-CoA reductase (NADPH) protein n=1 Tax=Dioscorea alata TaxID=55571 RepID=A0ACB7UVL7_DIOAL|nr:Hydroxymethylglutaryl-CoA reductase (NADPH) protein [Dioscorea alata]
MESTRDRRTKEMGVDRRRLNVFIQKVFTVLFFTSLYVLMRGWRQKLTTGGGPRSDLVHNRSFTNPAEIGAAVSLAVSSVYILYSLYRYYFEFVEEEDVSSDYDRSESRRSHHHDHFD